ncbi:glycosyltransferase [Clostridium brassicae]|uniref:Glycosyltransferase n=1 Tax=Clostridium brassicae TaxID=2999072 RepID=A0ABT4DB95_9CLOT|nr:glycosyltransferase [Clostridium brassicae]MCY6959580.1 glycosyltransferase [Clostridium brassicae]
MVTIIIPTFNSKKYIIQAVESVLDQTYKDIEVIVVDDGSTDGTCEKLEKYRDEIKYYYKENGGVASARNFGILKAKGDYICFLDADDIYEKDKLKEQVRFLQDNPQIDVVYNDIQVEDEKLNYINTLKSEGVYNDREDFLSMMLIRQIIPGPASIMFRRRCIEDGLKYNEEYTNAEDYDFTLRLAEKFNFAYIPKSLYVYRRHQNNLTNNHKKQFDNEIEIIKKIGIEKIKNIVWQSSFDELEKKQLFSKILIKIREWQKAKEVLIGILKYEKIAAVYFFLGNCYYFLQSYEEAKEYYENAIKLNPNMAEAYNNLGCALSSYNSTYAIDMFKKALNIRPGYMDAEININKVNEKNTDYKLTERELRKTLTMYK